MPLLRHAVRRLAIDWSFISSEEGGQQLDAYVPLPDTSQSGVTIGTGFDIGQRTEAEIDQLDVPERLKQKLKPYCGLRRDLAVQALAQAPLTIAPREAAQLDRAVKAAATDELRIAYDGAIAAGCVSFDELSAPAQTAIASVAFQYGSNLQERTPRFWQAVTIQDWRAAIAELRDFKDRFPSRRGREADLLETLFV